jgi:hypothetical protein
MQIISYSWQIFMDLLDRFSKKSQISNLIKIPLVGAELFHADERTDRHEETNSRVSQFFEGA